MRSGHRCEGLESRTLLSADLLGIQGTDLRRVDGGTVALAIDAGSGDLIVGADVKVGSHSPYTPTAAHTTVQRIAADNTTEKWSVQLDQWAQRIVTVGSDVWVIGSNQARRYLTWIDPIPPGHLIATRIDAAGAATTYDLQASDVSDAVADGQGRVLILTNGGQLIRMSSTGVLDTSTIEGTRLAVAPDGAIYVGMLPYGERGAVRRLDADLNIVWEYRDAAAPIQTVTAMTIASDGSIIAAVERSSPEASDRTSGILQLASDGARLSRAEFAYAAIQEIAATDEGIVALCAGSSATGLGLDGSLQWAVRSAPLNRQSIVSGLVVRPDGTVLTALGSTTLWADDILIEAINAGAAPRGVLDVTVPNGGTLYVSSDDAAISVTSDPPPYHLSSDPLVTMVRPKAPITMVNCTIDEGDQGWPFMYPPPGSGGGAIIDTDLPVVVAGSSGPDFIQTGGGNDTIRGNGGNDTISSGDGDDSVMGNTGDDQIDGGDGIDLIQGGLDADTVNGGLGNDSLYSGNGSDSIRGDDGDDYIEGRGKADTIYGGTGNDTIWSGAGSDLVYGDEGDDWADGGYCLFSDTIYGGVGNDTLQHASDDLNDVIDEIESVLG